MRNLKSVHYNELRGPLSAVIPWKGIWRVKAPWRVSFFLLDHSLGKILTGDNLIGVTCVRGVGSRRIIFCFIAMGPIAFELWSLEFCLFGLHWVMPHKVIELFESWQGKFRRHRNIDFWRLVPHCLMWCIWSKRNGRCFGGCERSFLEIKSFFLHTILIWSVSLSHSSCFS